jgi:hypothetical protein
VFSLALCTQAELLISLEFTNSYDSVMFFQQWTGVNAILYYAPSIFASLGLTGNTIGLLATGVVGIV